MYILQSPRVWENIKNLNFESRPQFTEPLPIFRGKQTDNIKIHQSGVQWKQGVVVYIAL